MNKNIPLFGALLLLGLTLSRLPAQSPAGPPDATLEVIARNGADHEKHLWSINGSVPTIMVRPNQTVPVTLQFPADKAGTQVIALPLDGGEIGGDDLVVLPTGRTMFIFSPGTAPGRYRVELHTPTERHLLEFYVVDPSNPTGSYRPGSN